MLSNAYFLAKIRFDTAENEPAKNLQNFCEICSLRPGSNQQPCALIASQSPSWKSSGGGSRAGGSPFDPWNRVTARCGKFASMTFFFSSIQS